MPSSTADELPYLTNEDVELLYSIVTKAQAAPGPPFGPALFQAYDEILAQQNVEDRGQTYFRFLLRMLAGRAEDESLFGRFKALLRKHDIEIDVNAEGDGVEEITRQIDGIEFHEGHPNSHPRHSQRPSRRASFSSVHDTLTWRDEEDTAASRVPAQVRSRKNKRPSSRATDPTSGRNQSRDKRARLLAQLPVRGRVNGRAVSESLHNRRRESVSSQRSIRIPRASGANGDDQAVYSADESEPYSSRPSRRVSSTSIPNGDHYVPPEMLYRPSDTQMLADADTFQYHTTFRLRRRLLQQWRDKALQSRAMRERMYMAADTYDRSTLLRQAFEQWRATLTEKRQIAETNRFFEHLERRASKARDLFLLTKAFTHWAQSASDEVLRTSVARRHILRTKYFNAWRDITAVNELKVRRLGLQKYLGVWRQRMATVIDNQITALTVYHENLAHRVYQRWYWLYCERMAAKRADHRLKRKFFGAWQNITRHLKERDIHVDQMRAHKLQRRAIALWSNRERTVRSYEPVADNFRRRMLVQHAFQELRIQERLAPLASQLSRALDLRIARKYLTGLNKLAMMYSQAAVVDRSFLLRNHFTAWNDRHRILQFEDSLAMRTLYNWRIHTYYVKWIRRQQTKRLRSYLLHWIFKTSTLETQLSTALQTFQRSQRTRLLRTVLGRWQAALQTNRQQEELALSVYQPRITQQVFETWRDRSAHLQELNGQAAAARFYILTTSALKRWREATHQSQRIRRREAYVHVRRRAKMGIVREMLNRWRSKTAEIRALERIATEGAEDRSLKNMTKLLATWRNRTASITEHSQQAEALRRVKLLTHTSHLWMAKYRQLQALNDRAATLRLEIGAVAAASYLRKLNWRLFQIQRHEETALALRERNWEKHVRSMLRYWAERAMQTRDERLQQLDRDADLVLQDGNHDSDAEDADLLGDEDATRAEEWTAFDGSGFDLGNLNFNLNLDPLVGAGPSNAHHDLPLATSTPLPGYLRTPSKRSTARAKARERLVALGDTAAGGGGTAGPHLAPGGAAAPTATPHVPQSALSAGPVYGAFTAPAAAGPSNAFAATPRPGYAITPFERKLRAQGYSARRARGRTPGTVGTGRGRGGGAGGVDGQVGTGTARRNVGFTGFDDIAEDDGSRHDEDLGQSER